MKSTGKTFAIVSLTLVMIVWGSAFPVSKSTLERLPPIFFAVVRHALASIALLIVVLVRRQRGILGKAPSWGVLTLMGLTSVTLYYVLYNFGLYYTTASQGALVQSVTPAVTAGLAVLVLHERVTRRHLAGIVLSILGVMIVVLSGVPNGEARNPALGTVLMLGTVAVWSVYTIIAKRVAGCDQFLLTAFSTTIGTAFLIPPAIWEGWGHSLPRVSPRDWLAMGYLSIVVSAIGYLVYNRSLRSLDAHQTISFTNLVPIVAVMAAVIFLGESIVPLQVAGGAIVLVGVWLAS